jgi:hypothetical protein
MLNQFIRVQHSGPNRFWSCLMRQNDSVPSLPAGSYVVNLPTLRSNWPEFVNYVAAR